MSKGPSVYYNWGKYPKIEGKELIPSFPDDIIGYLSGQLQLIARGNGRSYGDASLASIMVSLKKMNHILSFNPERSVITCQSGILLSDLLKFIVPKGFFPMVTPGTKYISLGGAIAADIHGKNHHKEGSISRYIESMDILTANGQKITCSKTENSPLFWATCGGMGLTGIILNASIQLKKIESAKIRTETIHSKSLKELFERFEKNMDITYTVSWIDCLTAKNDYLRSLFFGGEHATESDLEGIKNRNRYEEPRMKNVPVDFPSFALNKYSVKAFNSFYFASNRQKPAIKDIDPFFYPLDSVLNWNRIYGKKGFIQYQFVLPKATGYEGMLKIIRHIKEAQAGSFLTVLKLFGNPGVTGPLSFPMEGYTLAIDFKMDKQVHDLIAKLNDTVADYGGRIYLAKDAVMDQALFEKTYPRKDEFLQICREYDPDNLFVSRLSQRLGLKK